MTEQLEKSEKGRRKLIALTVDRLGAGYVGPYGNTWLETPAMNLLASQSVLFEHCLIDADQPLGFLSAALHRRHAATDAESRSLAELIRAQGGTSILITDNVNLSESELADDFDEVAFLAPDNTIAVHATEIEETQIARLTAGAIELLQQHPEATLIWIHVSGMSQAWDAPLELRNQLADEDDPVPPEILQPPSKILSSDYDPDEVSGLTFAYAGQVAVLDICLAALLDHVATLPHADHTALLFAGTRGFPLGEHLIVGDAQQTLHEELVHVPLMLRMPDAKHAMSRTQVIVQPGDVGIICGDWLTTGSSELLDSLATHHEQDRVAIIIGQHQNAIRTNEWYLVQSGSANQLYVKPDDRWDVNEVSNRMHELTEELRVELQSRTDRFN